MLHLHLPLLVQVPNVKSKAKRGNLYIFYRRDGVLAADATGMLRNEELITVAELREGELPPPA